MESVIDALSWFFLLGGAFFMLTAGIGVLRFPDVFTRVHASLIKDTMALGMTMIGLILQAGFSLVTAKLLLIWLFLWFASPAAGHSTIRAALLGGVRPILVKHQSEDPEEVAQVTRQDVRDEEVQTP